MDEPTVVMLNEKLNRIARALERIGDALERAHPTPEQQEDRQFARSKDAIRTGDAAIIAAIRAVRR